MVTAVPKLAGADFRFMQLGSNQLSVEYHRLVAIGQDAMAKVQAHCAA